MNKGKVILLTGATGKLGSIFLAHFLSAGYQVIFTSRNQRNISDILINLKVNTDHAYGFCVDLEEKNAIKNITNFIDHIGCLPNILINNARNLSHIKLNETGMPERRNWLGEMTLDVFVPYELTMSLLKQKESKLENVVNITSMYGVVAANPSLYDDPKHESPIHYSVAKAALIHLTKELAVRLSKENVRVNSLAYGGVEGRIDKAFEKRYAQLCPLGKMLTEQDIIGSIDFLVSDNSNGMTGHNLIVDGGWSIW